MSISAYTGLPGHGKSYGVVENVILTALKEKRPVFTNIPMNDNKCLDDFGMTVTPFDVADIVKNANWWSDVFTPGAVFVLDEVWKLWPAGLKANNVRESDKAFLAEHRHMVGENGLATEIYLVTQDLGQISAFARALVETTYRVVKMNHIGFDKTFRVDIFTGAVSGPKPPSASLLRQIPGKFKKDVYQYYHSHTKSKTGEAGDETRTDKRANVFGRFSIKAGFFACIFLFFVVVWGFGKVKEGYVYTEPAQPAVPEAPSSSSPGAQHVQVAAPRQPKEPDFLSKAKYFFVSWTLGQRGSREYFFTVEFDDYKIHMSQPDLERMGYQAVAVNDCLVRVKGHDYAGYAMCSKGQPPKEWFQRVVGTGQSESEVQ